ncbi:MAG: hypothetical protein JSR22_09215, partial [Proteobacteria bacterium]|nr:hypothetical protein [Pseudomonadota bacterium]
TELISDYLYRVKLGLKSKYYMNQKTSAGMRQLELNIPKARPEELAAAEHDSDCEACTL